MAYAKLPLTKNGLTLSNAEYSLCRICVHSSSAPVLSGQEDKLDIHIYFQVVDRSIHHIPQILVHHMTRVLSEINSQGLGRVKLREQRQLVLLDEKNESSLLSNFHLFTSPTKHYPAQQTKTVKSARRKRRDVSLSHNSMLGTFSVDLRGGPFDF